MHQHPHPVTPKLKRASIRLGCWLCEPAAACCSSCPYMPVVRGCSLTSCWCGLRFCLGPRVTASLVCVCFSGMEDSYTVTCGLPLPCLAADAQRNGSGSHCAGECKTRQIGICLSATASQKVSRGGGGPVEVWVVVHPPPPPPDPSVPPMHTMIKRGDALLRLRRF